MKEKRHVCFGGALTKGKKLKYITHLVLKSYASQASVIFVNNKDFFLFVKETPISSCSRKNQKNQ